MIGTSVETQRAIARAQFAYVGSHFETRLGREFRPRLEAGERYYERNSWDWDDNLDLFLSSYRRQTGWVTTIAMAHSLVVSSAYDAYYQNPESWIQAKSGDPSGDLSKMVRDVANAIHKDADTEGIMQRGLIMEAIAGFAVHWAYFEQEDEYFPAAIDPSQPDASADVVHGEDGGAYEPQATSQTVCGQYVSPHHMRFDPEGRRWDLRDHKWIARIYFKTLQEILDSPHYHDEGKRMLNSWATTSRLDMRFSTDFQWSDSYNTETDPNYMVIPVYEIWTRAGYQVIHIPLGAQFDIANYGWPEEFKRAKKFPATFIAFNWHPEDRQMNHGFYPIPLIRQIRPQLEDLNRVEGLYLDAATLSILKYLTIQGIIDDTELAKITTDQTRAVIQINLTKLQSYFPGFQTNPEHLNLRNIFTLLPQEERASTIKHLEAIEHIILMMSRVIGTGPMERYGVPSDGTATGIAALQAAMTSRKQVKVAMAGNIYDAITEKFFLIIKERQSLPIEYQASTDYNEGVWRQFHASQIRGINLAFRHRVGSNGARDPKAEAAARAQTGNILISIYGAAGDQQKVDTIAKWMLEPLDFSSLDVFNNDAKAIAQQLAVLIMMLKFKPSLAANPKFADAKGDLASKLVMATLTPAEMQAVATQVEQMITSSAGDSAGGGSSVPLALGQGGGGGTPSAPASRGEQAYAGAQAAGRSHVGV